MSNNEKIDIKYDDQVQINCPDSQYHGMEGRVICPGYGRYPLCAVAFDNGEEGRFRLDALVRLTKILSFELIPYAQSEREHYMEHVWGEDIQNASRIEVRTMGFDVRAKFQNNSSTQSDKSIFVRCLRHALERLEEELKEELGR